MLLGFSLDAHHHLVALHDGWRPRRVVVGEHRRAFRGELSGCEPLVEFLDGLLFDLRAAAALAITRSAKVE
jgi:hypothetical protein